jgi:hypothetical protein
MSQFLGEKMEESGSLKKYYGRPMVLVFFGKYYLDEITWML